MDIMTAYCGLACNSCPIHLASLEQDRSRQQAMRISIAQFCSEHYKMRLRPEEICDCDGCRAGTGNLFSGCRECEIRKCASRKSIESCGYCADYACDKLEELFKHEPGARICLEEIRNQAG